VIIIDGQSLNCPQRQLKTRKVPYNKRVIKGETQMDKFEMLTQREQLMEDIDCIIESNFGEVEYKDDVIRQLCDAVCNNFPTVNWG